MKPIPLPVLGGRPHVPCTQCAKCCTYVAVGINAPTRPRYATDILWYLYHDGVSVHREEDGQWSVVFETRCSHLERDLLCGVYEERPHICRSFDDTSCEVNAPTGGQSFTSPAEFLAYLRAEQPRLLRSLERGFVPGEAAASGRRMRSA